MLWTLPNYLRYSSTPPTVLQKLQEKVVYFIKIQQVLSTVCDVFRKNPTSVINCLLLLNKKGPQNNQGPFFDEQIYHPMAPIYHPMAPVYSMAPIYHSYDKYSICPPQLGQTKHCFSAHLTQQVAPQSWHLQ